MSAPRIDAHHHLWDPATRAYPWMAGEGLAPIRRRYDLDALRDNAARLGVEHTVLVQTVSDEDETREFLRTAQASDGLIAGVVGWVDLSAPDVADRLAALREGHGGRLLVGIRHQVENEADPHWLGGAAVLRGIHAVARAGLAYDLLVQQAQWQAALELALAMPDVRLVLDHAGKPPIASGDLREWSRWLGKLAACNNVTVKLSGLATEAHWGSWSVADLQPVGCRVLELFGADRVMLGSDWPVCELAGPAEQVWAATRALVPQDSLDAALGGTAAATYRLSI